MLQLNEHTQKLAEPSGLENGIWDNRCPLLAQSRHNWYRTEQSVICSPDDLCRAHFVLPACRQAV